MISARLILGRSTALFLLVALCAGILLVIVAVCDQIISRTDDEELQLLAAHHKLVSIAESKPVLQKQLQQLSDQARAQRGLVQGPTSAAAAANLQASIKAVIEAHRGQVRSAQALPPNPAGAVERIEIRYDISLPAQALRDFLYAIEAHEPYLFFRSITADAPESSRSPTGVEADEKLSIRCAISGYRISDNR